MAAAAPEERRRYDFIVVGAGSAGCVLANRLTESGRWRVLLLEAGPKKHWLSPMPVSFAKLIDNPAANWCYRSEPDDGSGGRAIPIPRGKLLGGSSAINGLVFVRGQRLDYDIWAQLGNRGWSYDDVLPVFRRMEHFEGGADGEWRARGGPLRVSEVPDESPLYDALFRAGREVGLPRNPDYNGAAQEGMCKTQATISRGRRMSAAHCYLRPARGRANLRVASGSLARGLLLEGAGGDRLRCTGVRYTAADGREVEVRAGREVVLCAGSVNSPQLLELSGIGRPGVLREHGIGVACALPGVGENLIDHMAPRVVLRLKRRGATYNERARGLGLAWQVVRYAAAGSGFLSLPSAPVLAFLRSREGLETPDVQVHFAPYSVKSPHERVLLPDPGMTCTTYVLRPESRGSIHVRSRDPAQAPAIRFNFLLRRVGPPCAHRQRALGAEGHGREGHGRFPGRGTEAGAGSRVRRRDRGVDPGDGRDRVPPGRDLQDGPGSDGGGGRPAAGARRRGAARRGRLHHADPRLGQHQRHVHHDRREGVGDDAGGHGRRLTERGAAPPGRSLFASGSGSASARRGSRKWPEQERQGDVSPSRGAGTRTAKQDRLATRRGGRRA